MAKEKIIQDNSGKRAVLIISHLEAKDRIQEQIDKGRTLKTTSERNVWLVYVRELLRRIVDNDELLDQFNNDYSFTESYEENFSKSVIEAINILEAIFGKIDLIPEPSKESLNHVPLTISLGNKVFIVHGHDDGIRESVARMVEKLKLNPIVLQEQPNQGKTIIEKFLDHSDVSFAIVLLTGDDRGGTKNDTFDNQRLRARQNVIFELGFFIGRLGREHVCALFEEGVEIPSDYQGVLFVPIDKGGNWKWQVAKEMKNSGLEIDLNLL